MKAAFAAFLLFLIFPFFVSSALAEDAYGRYEEEKKVYLDIVRNTPGIDLALKAFLLEIFIKKSPDSPLCGQAELRVAEYLQIHYSYKFIELKTEEELLIEKAAGDEKTIEGLRRYYERQRAAAFEERKFYAPMVFRYLTKIIEQRGQERVYRSLVDEWNDGEYLASWALYYRGVWFGRGDDLRLLLKKYPKCGEPCRWAEEIIKAGKKK